jgi:hypothetical protein
MNLNGFFYFLKTIQPSTFFQWSKREWVDRWASSSLPTTGLDCHEVDEDEDDFDDSFMSLRESEGGRSRRRLPATPHKGSVTNGATDECLQVLKGYLHEQ